MVSFYLAAGGDVCPGAGAAARDPRSQPVSTVLRVLVVLIRYPVQEDIPH